MRYLEKFEHPIRKINYNPAFENPYNFTIMYTMLLFIIVVGVTEFFGTYIPQNKSSE